MITTSPVVPTLTYEAEVHPSADPRPGIKIDPEVLKSLNTKEMAMELPDMPLENPEESYFEGLFPKGQVHLIGGPSGAGKTTVAFQIYKALSNIDGEWLGRKTVPAAWAYISGDRASNSVRITQRRLGVDFKVFSLVDLGMVGEDLITAVMPRLTKFYGYRPNFIYIDGFTGMCPQAKINDYGTVSKWLATLQMFCQRKNITILGAVHATKTKEGERYTNPRQRVAGSVAWAGYSETIVVVEPPEGDKDDGHRKILLLPRNSVSDTVGMEFNQAGDLQVSTSSNDAKGAEQFVLGNIVAQEIKPGEEFYYLRIWTKAKEKGVNRRTFDRWLAKEVENGVLVRVKKGIYRKPIPVILKEKEEGTK